MHYSITVLLLIFFIYASDVAYSQKYSQRRRRSKEIEDRINRLDESTKSRIHAMKATGMPSDAIADKISYTTGGKNMAKRIVDAISDNKSDYSKKEKNNKLREEIKKKITKAAKLENTKASNAERSKIATGKKK